MIIGITGMSGSGKTTLANKICEISGYKHINVDEISHQILNTPEMQKRIFEEFGVHVSETSRAELGDIVFNNRHAMNDLSDILWNDMKKEIKKQIAESNNNCVIEWILLSHSGFFNMCNTKILVQAPLETRKARVIQRDNISAEYFDKREANSISYDKSQFDYVVVTDN